MTRDLLQFAATIALRVTLVLIVAGLISYGLRRASATLRYWVWVLAMSATLLMPALVMMAPRWTIGVPHWSKHATPATSLLSGDGQFMMQPTALPITMANQSGNQSSSSTIGTTSNPTFPTTQTTALLPQNPSTRPNTTRPAIKWPDWKMGVLSLWILGAASVLASSVWQYFKIARLTHVIPDPSWQHEMDDLRVTLNIRRPIHWVVTDKISVPMTIGLRRPVILLPAESAQWTSERRWVVLVHEGIHIARWDALIGWLSLSLLALHWFNPLAWIATRRLAIEGETACDDRVLQLGTSGPDYAAHLLAIARKTITLAPGVSQMANPQHLHARIHLILDKQRRRGVSRWQRLVGIILVPVLMLPATSLTAYGDDAQRRGSHKAQADTVLTVAMPEEFFGSLSHEGLFLDEFESNHPGVRVVLRRDDSGYPENTMASDPSAYLEDMTDFADGADVLFNWTSNYLNPVTTRAGLFLNLAPAIAADPELDISRYFPAAWASYQWDGGVWGMPSMLDPVFIVYNRSAFDAAGLTYPDDSWTMDQYAAAARALISTDADGNTIPGLTGDPTFLFRALLGRPFYNMADPTQPLDFAGDVALLALAKQWLGLTQEGAVAVTSYYEAVSPIQITSSWAMSGIRRDPNSTEDEEWAAALLPGGVAGLQNVSGFVVSAGTQSPQVAYELAKHLSLITTYLDTLPIAAMSAVLDPGGDLDIPNAHFYPGKTEAQRAADFEAAQRAFPLTERLMTPFLMPAFSATSESELETAFANADAQGTGALALADELRSTFVLNIPPERPPVEVPPGQVALQFHLTSPRDNIPNFEQWEQAAADFAAQDEEVFSVDLMTGWGIEEGQQPDCYLVANYFDPAMLLPLDPLLAADPKFDETDFAPGALDAMRVNGQIIAYPLVLQPEMLWADMDVLQQAGVIPTDMNWDISTFVEAITQVKDAGLADYGFGSQSDSRLNWIILMMAYGGLPVDFSTTPATVNLTDPTTQEAIQLVLDLVKNGYIGENLNQATPLKTAGVMTETVFDVPYHLAQQANQTLEGNFRLMNYPTGSRYTPVSYLAQGASINPNSQNIEACYRWISYLATRPELMLGLPAQRSQLDNPALTAIYGPQTVQTFRDYFALLDSPDAKLMPFYWTDDVVLETAVSTWIDRAFDTYLDGDNDLASALGVAQTKIDEYRTCMADVPIPNYMNTTLEEVTAYEDAMELCLQAIDPDLLTQEPFIWMFSED